MSTETANRPAMRIVKNDDVTSRSDPGKSQNSSSDSAVCEICFGTGVEVVSGKGARPCSCQAQDARRAFLDAARIPRRYAKCVLDTFKYQPNSSQYFAYELARSLVADYPHIDRGLLLMGPAGVGKTHLAVAVLRGLIGKGVPCLFYESGSLLKRIQSSYNPISKTSETSVLAPVYEAEVLVLDELGATIPTDWVRDTLYQIINTRYNDRKLTIFTTNFADERPVNAETADEHADDTQKRTAEKSHSDRRHRTTKTPTLEERIGIPLRSRLYEMCHKVEISGEDYRKRFEKSPAN